MSFFKTSNGKIVLYTGIAIVATGYLMKRAREEIAAGKPAKDTWAGKVGLVG